MLGSPCCALTGAAPRHAKDDAPLWREEFRLRATAARRCGGVYDVRLQRGLLPVVDGGCWCCRLPLRLFVVERRRRAVGAPACAHTISPEPWQASEALEPARAGHRPPAFLYRPPLRSPGLPNAATRTKARDERIQCASPGPARRGFKRGCTSAAGARQAATAERLRAAREARGRRHRGERLLRLLLGDRR